MMLRNIIVSTMILTLLTAVGCRSFDEPRIEEEPQGVNISLKAFSEIVGEKSLVVDMPIVAGGYVISSDEESNFYKSLVIDDGTAAIEIMVGLHDSFNIYPLGYYLTIALQGCGAGRHYGVVQVGRAAKEYGYYPAEYFSSRVVLDKYVTLYDDYQVVEPQILSVSALDKSMCGRLVRVENLQLASQKYPDAWQVNTEGKWMGYNFFEDAEGCPIVVYTSDYASYGEHPIADGPLAITGILQHGNVDGEERFMLKMRYEKDCQSEF